MDDSCAVCAETLEWVAYGACGHRDVCSTCVARLRFICNDSRCCICKTENSVVFVTKALGEYTRLINDFSLLPSEPREGRLGSYWYHEDTQAFFDDVDHYRMIKAMCKLSCSVCDKAEDKSNDAPKRRQRFRNIEQLKGHLFHQHKLLMCSLCLEGRKVFICEQKLYTRAQLNRHISTGDSEVDGTESERGGFAGHPMCEFCRTPFYGDNELYMHMSTEHYTCFICQRQHPGQYEYFKNYDDLEIHFRHEHFLCEDEGCLSKKFIVFQSEAEMKRHNALEHGGSMSRAKRNAALQIPTSFRYRGSSEQDRRRGRGRTFRRDFAEDQISAAIQASLEYANADSSRPGGSSLSDQMMPDPTADNDDTGAIVQPFEALTTIESEQPSKYLQALGQNYRNAPLQEAAFPPLMGSSSSSNQVPKQDSEVLRNTMADHLRRQNNNRNLNVDRKWNATGFPSSTTTSLPSANIAATSAPLGGVGGGSAASSYASLAKAQALSRAAAAAALRVKSASPSTSSSGTGKISHSTSAPNLAEKEFVEPCSAEFPQISAAVAKRNQTLPKFEDVQVANKSLVEKIRAALNNDQEKYTSFKEISAHYRQGSIDTETYLDYVRHFGLSHLILDLARLCPDPEKQKELLETYNSGARKNGLQENGWGQGGSSGSKKGKGKQVDALRSNRNTLAESIMGTVRDLQLNYKSAKQEVEVLMKDGYRTEGKSKATTDDEQPVSGQSQSLKLEKQMEDRYADAEVYQNLGDRGGGRKQKKKTSKFHRNRLGEGSMASALDLKDAEPDSEPDPAVNGSDKNDHSSGGLPLRGVWERSEQKSKETKLEEEKRKRREREREMSSFVQKNRSAAQHVKALSRRLRSYGFRCDELGSKEALNRLPSEMVDAGNQGLKRALDRSVRPGRFPENLQAIQSPFRSSLLAHVKKEAGQIPVLHQARFFSSVTAEQIQTGPADTKKNILRPLSPHLPVYQPHLNSTLSITHRITGAFLSAAILSFHLIYLKMGPICLTFGDFYQFLFYSSKLTLVSLELCGLAFAYHVLNGIRHMRKDFGGIAGKRLK